MLILASGGMDCYVLAHSCKAQEIPISFVFFDYGQDTAKAEEERVAKWANEFKTKTLVHHVELAYGLRRSANDKNMYIPWRNLVLIAHACTIAQEWEEKSIALGVHKGDYTDYPDCRFSFFSALNSVLWCGGPTPIVAYTPFVDITKTEIVKQGQELGVDWSRTWSCYRSNNKPCQVCASCIVRAKAFAEALIKDPLNE